MGAFGKAGAWVRARWGQFEAWDSYRRNGPPCPETNPSLDPGPVAVVPAGRMREPSARSTGRRFLDWFRAYRPEPAPSHIGPVEQPPRDGSPRIGICCSGGGIRSAAFNLGALQALQEREELQRSCYLSAVSGGAYIAAAFATVARRWPAGTPRPAKYEAGHDDSDPDLFSAATPPFYRGSPEEQYLRNRASYIAPTDASKLLLALRLVLGLLWNLVVLGTALLVVGVAAGFVYAEYFFMPKPGVAGGLELDVPTWAWWVQLAFLVPGLLCAILLLVMRPRDAGRRMLERWTIRLLGYGLIVAFVLFLAPQLIEWLRQRTFVIDGSVSNPTDDAAIVAVTSFVTVIAGVVTQLRTQLTKTEERLQQETEAKPDGVIAKAGGAIRKTIVYLAALIAVPLLAVLAFTLAASWPVGSDADGPPLVAAGASAVAFAAVYFFADLTTWSLHPFYKRRLAVAFALKRVKRHDGDRFGMAVERDYNVLPLITEADVDARDEWPVLIVCAAANVSDFGATPPGRSVTSFTFSAGAIGGPLVGAVRPDHYRDVLGEKRARHHLSLLTAVAVSGAALSPSMGKETRRPLRALLALANVRLGVWMRNPRHIAKAVDEDGSKPEWTKRFVRRRPRPSYLLYELFGMNFVDGKYLYVTDGGHYENLGLVELLRRGCTEIYCFDASGGKPFAALGDAIALARSEVGVEIDIKRDRLEKLRPDPDTRLAETECVVGEITYARTNGTPVKGRIVYARTVRTAAARADVHAFHESDPRFPNHSTTDQLYTDQKFEAYRALGEGAGAHACTAMRKARTADRRRVGRAAARGNGGRAAAAANETESQSLV